MATVIHNEGPDKGLQAVLRVDSDGYLMVTGIGGGGSSTPTPCPDSTPEVKEVVRERVVERTVEVVKTEIREVIKELRTVPTEAELDALLQRRQEALREKAARQIKGADLTPQEAQGLREFPLGASFARTPGGMIFKPTITQDGGATFPGGRPAGIALAPDPTPEEAASVGLTQDAYKALISPPGAKRLQMTLAGGVDPYLSGGRPSGGINPVYVETWLRIECVQPVALGRPQLKLDTAYVERYLDNSKVDTHQSPREPLGPCPFLVTKRTQVPHLQGDTAVNLPTKPGDVLIVRYGTRALTGKYLGDGYTLGWNAPYQTTQATFKVSIYTRASYQVPPTGNYDVIEANP